MKPLQCGVVLAVMCTSGCSTMRTGDVVGTWQAKAEKAPPFEYTLRLYPDRTFSDSADRQRIVATRDGSWRLSWRAVILESKYWRTRSAGGSDEEGWHPHVVESRMRLKRHSGQGGAVLMIADTGERLTRISADPDSGRPHKDEAQHRWRIAVAGRPEMTFRSRMTVDVILRALRSAKVGPDERIMVIPPSDLEPKRRDWTVRRLREAGYRRIMLVSPP